MTDLFPKPPRRMRQPPKDVLREQLAIAADALIEEREANERLQVRLIAAQLSKAPLTVYVTREPWWRRIFRRAA